MIARALFLLLLCCVSHGSAAAICQPQNYDASFPMTIGNGRTICAINLGTDTTCVLACFECYQVCLGQDHASAFAVDGVGVSSCSCTDESSGVLPVHATLMFMCASTFLAIAYALV